ncbi:MAG: peptide-methionine (S)-S-oxide reductase MsrA [Bacilli bacterium]|nr:peptide-methionine (S)-S-oxide reductase MsrA [Bacilli bacterium]
MKKTIYLAGGCFWGVEEYFSRLKGTISTEVGYANGSTANPAYEDLKAGKADHAETLKLVYDDEVLPLQRIIEHYLRFVDPFSVDRQGHDVGHQYRTGIFSDDESDLKKASEILLAKVGPKHKIDVTPLTNFYSAEEYHQDYLKKNPHGYCHVDLSLIKPSEAK